MDAVPVQRCSLAWEAASRLLGGVLRRAPRLMQRMGCEWLYRLLLEPRRLWKRYLIGNGQFLWIVLRQAADGTAGSRTHRVHIPMRRTPAPRPGGG